MKNTCLTFELRRQTDGLVYRFDRQPDGSFKRQDGDFFILRHPRHGWIAGDVGSDEIFGRPWSVLPSDQGDAPPEGIWVSRKDAKSYVYDLVYDQAATK
ncbi:MAG: hypothetical protein AAGF74_14210 [Pseudomonadota bacterium]